jgi:hypothetical protein
MVVRRSQLAAVEVERDEWRRRAEEHPTSTVRTEYVFLRSPRWVRLVAASWLVLLALLVAGVAVPRANDTPSLSVDHESCIAAAREKSPRAENPYRELVNALYACGVYESP